MSIPFPKFTPAAQIAIITTVHRSLDSAVQLRADAEAGWQASKQWFVEQLLGPVQ
ncbi:MAG: hypothetical protein P4L81_00135 [Candidatus Pacebacteria bacterium]|nr:hypothetical protein [Candidatus Paceibacterota bacterium]